MERVGKIGLMQKQMATFGGRLLEFREQYEKAYPVLLAKSEEMAERGWLVSPNMEFTTLTELLSEKNISDYYIRYYQEEQNYLSLKNGIMECSLYSSFKTLLDEVFYCFENELYKITIPSTISILEGGLTNLTDSKSYGRRFIKDFRKMEDAQHEETVIYIFHNAIFVYLDTIFQNYDFDNNRKDLLNRNWVLHGKDNPELREKIDALMLLNALYSISLLSRTD